jgi:hypothetical protein
MKAASGSEQMSQLAKVLSEQHKALHMALLPFRDLTKSSAIKWPTNEVFATLNRQVSLFHNQFRLPEMPEVQRLVRQYEQHKDLFGTMKLQSVWSGYALDLQRTMGAMHQPWLNAQNIAQSFSAFGDLQGIGQALRTLPPYDLSLTKQLRSSLGDWQKRIDFQQYALTDPMVRTDLYIARGLDSALTAFPADTFLESTTKAGLRPQVRPGNGDYIENEIPAENEDEDGFIRTNAAHNRLMRFETHLRNFIEMHMLATVGEKWIKQRVPAPMMRSWEEKREKAVNAGEQGHALIAYADFTDYVAIITRKDNWEGMFSQFFQRSTFVQESFQRLYPIRVCTMHSRLITQDDELYLLVETKRLLKAMGIDVN